MEYIITWFVCGFIAVAIAVAFDWRNHHYEITVRDVVGAIFLFLFGTLSLIGMLIGGAFEAVSKCASLYEEHQDDVVWRLKDE